MKFGELYKYGKLNSIETSELNLLFAYIFKISKQEVINKSEETVDNAGEKKFKRCIKRLKKGEPLQYITNEQEFMKLKFFVNKNVLIPQPDTEILVEKVLEKCLNKDKKIKILDLCTGSGAIAVSLAKYLENASIVATDISKKALKIAKKNSQFILKDNNKINFIKSDLFNKVEAKFDVIVTNPPYIKREVIQQLSREVKKEPIIALDGGKDGLKFYKKIIEQANNYLNNGGWIFFEIGFDQKEEVEELLKTSNKFIEISTIKDLSGNDRVVMAKLR